MCIRDSLFTGLTQRSLKALVKPLKEIDFDTILLLLGLFLVIGGIKRCV